MSIFTRALETVLPLLPDSAAVWSFRQYVNHRFQHLGHMTHLQIDPVAKKAFLELELKGENQPVQITVDRYQLISEGGKLFLEIREFHASREWINHVAGPLLKGRRFEVPDLVKAVL